MLNISIDTENDAFKDQDASDFDADHESARASECARILRELADKIERGSEGGKILDINGNRVGFWSF